MKKLFLLIAVISLSACSTFQRRISDRDQLFIDKYLKANLAFLSSDELEGREATSRGEKLASLFIASELSKYGVQPFGDSGTYFQNFPLQVSGFEENSKIIVSEDSVNHNFKIGDDFVRASWSFPSADYFNKKSALAFAGYGITAPEFEFDDYAGLDVKGKTVVVLAGEPESDDPDFFKGEKRSAYSKVSAKLRIAADNGAVGLIVLPDSNVIKYWSRYSDWTKSEAFRYSGSEGRNSTGIPAFSLNNESASVFLSSSGLKPGDLANYIDDYKRPEDFAIKDSLYFDITVYTKTKYARNVVGIISGIDDSLKNEFVVLSSHYDHLGKRGEDIYNGADDDGSGTAAILDAARTLSEAKENKRSILFVFHTAEEKGLLGSRYFTEHFDKMDKIRTDINLDMVGRGSADSIYSIGSGKLSAEFYNLVRSANKESVNFAFNYKFDDPNDPNRFYYRSDHVHYAKKGIPIVFFYDYLMKDYHRSTDTVEKINFEKLTKITNLVHHLALKISNLNHKLKIDKKE